MDSTEALAFLMNTHLLTIKTSMSTSKQEMTVYEQWAYNMVYGLNCMCVPEVVRYSADIKFLHWMPWHNIRPHTRLGSKYPGLWMTIQAPKIKTGRSLDTQYIGHLYN